MKEEAYNWIGTKGDQVTLGMNDALSPRTLSLIPQIKLFRVTVSQSAAKKWTEMHIACAASMLP